MSTTSEVRTARPARVERLAPEHWRSSYDLFMAGLHLPATSDERWAQVEGLYRPGLVYGSRVDDTVVATLMTTPLGMVVPGGGVLPVAGSTAGGVRSGHTRRGLYAALMSTRLQDLAEAGETFLVERPSVATLYQRWGSGEATATRTLRVHRDRSTPRADLPAPTGVVRQPVDGGLREVLAAVHARAVASGARPGMVHRSPAWWDAWDPYRGAAPTLAAATYEGPGGETGYVTWAVDFEGVDVASMRRVLTVVELVAGSPEVAAVLWRYLLHLDLVEEIRAPGRPLDEAVPLLLHDRRACRVEDTLDEMWLRIIDVPAALAARRWGSGTGSDGVVVEIVDEHLPANGGRYRISGAGVDRVATDPQLTVPVSALAAAYLGGTAPSQLAAVGLVAVHDRAAVPVADRLFATGAAPWCGTMF
ncbi:GNAT family N-acetyltransferase [Pseudonocardia sp. WMMC193]|uniref:GNAT family N-acetyltransferase n=1 Tax=Pseudonocardia sp. WMMC193 TaxID=2911965 RepID=UPI001F210AA0|nr:GNAT family N-acetyltransferase [Pseudonocardia sp. WMMC193]MCF7549502.1 GNAT family N-acetyltransferase [Pseudonocardia sp. WMMC193]